MRILILLVGMLPLYGCAAMVVGGVVGVAATVAIEAAKVPVKVGGAAVDLMTDDDDEDGGDDEGDDE